MAGIEEVSGHRSANYWNQKLLRFNDKYIKGFLTQGDGHSFTDTFELLYNIIPHRSKKWTHSAPAVGVDDDEVFKDEPASTPTAIEDSGDEDTEGGKHKKQRSFKTSLGHLTRAGSKGQRPSRSSLEDKDSKDDLRTLAAAFARNAFYQVPEKDEVDDERQQREAREAKRQASDRRKANRWTSAKTRLEVMAAGSHQPPSSGTSTDGAGGADVTDGAGAGGGGDTDELGPLRKLLAAKRSSFFAVAEGALLKKWEDERKASMASKSSADCIDSRKASEASATPGRQDQGDGYTSSDADAVSKLDEDISIASESAPGPQETQLSPPAPPTSAEPDNQIVQQIADQMVRTAIEEATASSHSETAASTIEPKQGSK